jgi:putative transcriptional regulator
MAVRKPVGRDETRRRRHELHRRAGEGELPLPDAIRHMRNALGMTQAKFAGCFGLTRVQVSELENGKSNPTFETLARIGKPFGFQVGFVLSSKQSDD